MKILLPWLGIWLGASAGLFGLLVVHALIRERFEGDDVFGFDLDDIDVPELSDQQVDRMFRLIISDRSEP